ncbi:MAG: UMP kinase [bacterium]
MSKLSYKKILLKASGTLLVREAGFGISSAALAEIAGEVKKAQDHKLQIAIEIGGGNLYRFRNADKGINRVTADQAGMMASIMNAIHLRDALQSEGLEVLIHSSYYLPELLPRYDMKEVRDAYDAGKIVIFAAGTGKPYFTTDTGAALHAVAIGAEVIIKATDVDGVYDSDPDENVGAKRYDKLTFAEAIEKKLAVMDKTAFELCQQNNLPIIVFNGTKDNFLDSLIKNKAEGTLVTN